MKQNMLSGNIWQLSQWFLFAFCLCPSASSLAFTLEDAIISALKIDPSIRSSELNQLAIKENIAIARSRLLPQISLQGSSNQLTQILTSYRKSYSEIVFENKKIDSPMVDPRNWKN